MSSYSHWPQSFFLFKIVDLIPVYFLISQPFTGRDHVKVKGTFSATCTCVWEQGRKLNVGERSQ
jgi:hypothetical protein